MKNHKKLVIFIPSIEEGGVEKNLFIVTNFLAKKLKKVSVITASKNKKKFFKRNVFFISPKSSFWQKKSRLLKTFIF